MFETWPFSAERRNSVFFFCHSQISLICMIYLSLPNLYFYTFRSLTVFLKVLNKVYFIIIYYWLTPVRKTLRFELSAINHSLSEKRIILFLSCWSSPMFLFFITYMGLCFPAVELNNMIQFSTLSRMPGFLWHSSKWVQWLSHFLHYMSGIEVLACSLDTNLNYVSTMLQVHPTLNH